MRKGNYTDNQIKAIKKLQWLSYNDEEFRVLTGFRDMTFNDVITSDFWSLDELEDMGDKLNNGHTMRTFLRNKGRKKQRTRAQKISSKEQMLKKSRSLNKRDGRTHVTRKPANPRFTNREL